MQSSPPVRAWNRRASQEESDYSLDLGALDMDTVSDMDIPKQKVDRIFSEDIDGPSDFTQNMDMYLRGGKNPSRKGTMKKSTTQTTTQTITEALEVAQNNVQRRDMLKVTQKATGNNEEEHTGSNHTPDHSPPKASPYVHEEPFSSEWNTYNSSTPAPPVHKQFLQPTVEEYYSELSPGRRAAVHSRSQSAYASPHLAVNPSRGRPSFYSPRPAEKRPPAQQDGSTPGRASSPTLSPVRSPVIQRSTTSSRPGTAGTAYSKEVYDDEEKYELELQLSQLSAKCQQLEQLNRELDQQLEEDKRIRERESAAHEQRLADAARRERDLAEMKEAAYQHSDGFRREFTELKEKLREQEREAEKAKLGSEGSEKDLRDEVKRLKQQMETERMGFSQERKSMEHDLQLARRSRDHAMEEAKAHREELEARNGLQEAEVERLREALRQAQDDETAIAELERRLIEANAEVSRLKQDKSDLETMIAAVRAQLAKSKHDQQGEINKAIADRTRAVELAGNFQRQLNDLRQQLKEEQTSHKEEIENLRSSRTQSDHTTTQELQLIQNELQAKQSELNEAILERDEAQDALQNRESEVEKAWTELDNVKAVNATLDARLTEKMQRREKYWREKLEEADRERKLMARTLMHQWGRQEVGVESPQAYKYKYAASPVGKAGRERAKSVAAA